MGPSFHYAGPVARGPAVAAGPLEIGFHRALHIREERVSPSHDSCRLLYISDIHLRRRRSRTLSRQVLDAASRSAPHVILLGGDMVDQGSELESLRRLVASLQIIAPVLAIGGNHDHELGLDRVSDAVVDGGGHWIHACGARLRHGARVIAVSGPDTRARLEGDVRVLCAHNPRVWKTSRRAGYHLVLAGHLHGCQIVAYEYGGRLFPGTILYPYCFLSHRIDQTRLVVSRGVSDLVPLRWRCPREVVLCHV